MAEITWIKLTTNIFEDEKINFIESLPDSDSLIVIWLKLLTLAGKINDGGFIYLTEKMPYTAEMLSNKFNRPLNTIKLALTTFQELEMIELIDNKIFISKWEKHQSIDEMAKIKAQTRERVAKHRELKRLEMNSLTCQYCGGIATGYDHILATSRGGSDDISNKVECCIECNRIKNDKPLIDFLNNNRNRINNEIIKNNNKLRKLVTLCNVTDRYTVTQCNAIEEKENKKENRITTHTQDEFSNFNLLGKRDNVYLTDKHLNELDCLIGSRKKVLELIDELSDAIAIGKYSKWNCEIPDAHCVLVEKFHTYKKKNNTGIKLGKDSGLDLSTIDFS